MFKHKQGNKSSTGKRIISTVGYSNAMREEFRDFTKGDENRILNGRNGALILYPGYTRQGTIEKSEYRTRKENK